jgi:hypothetical protein
VKYGRVAKAFTEHSRMVCVRRATSARTAVIGVQPDGSLRSTLAIAAMVFQLRVVTETP